VQELGRLAARSPPLVRVCGAGGAEGAGDALGWPAPSRPEAATCCT
jgi:hypothetical protein